MPFLRWLSVGLLAAVLTGCAGYHLGPTGGAVAGAKSIQVNFFQNKTLEPRLSDAIAASLRKTLQQDGTYRLSTRGGADLIVTGTITRYDHNGLSYQAQDVLTVRDYAIQIFAHVKAVEAATGKTVLEREISGRTVVRIGTDLPSAEREALPILADDFAKNATSLLTEGVW